MCPVWPYHFQPNVVRESFGERLSSYVLVLEAWRRGLTVTTDHPRLHRFTIRGASGTGIKFIQARPSKTTRKAHVTAKNKHRSNQLLSASGVPVPHSELIDPQEVSVDDLIHRAESIGYPVVLKPRNGAMGIGVFANIENGEVLKRRYTELTQRSSTELLMLENHVPGDDYRVLVFGGHYVAACQRVPANITGDGVTTIRGLISRENRERRDNPFLSKGLIKKDQEVSDHLAQHGYDYNSVPEDGEYLRLRSAANASAGGDVVDVTEELPQRIRDSAVRAVDAIPGLHCAGVDVLYAGPGKAPEGDHYVLELNSQPQIGVNMYPTHGRGADVPKKIIDICFPDSQRADRDDDAQVALRLHPALRPLASTHAAEVTFPPIPATRFPVRYLYALDRTDPLSARQVRRTLRQSENHSVSGFLRRQDDSTQLMIAGRQSDVDAFADSVATIIEAKLNEPQPWSGPVFVGFEIDL